MAQTGLGGRVRRRGRRVEMGIEVGCGYGRVTMVLAELCEHVLGLEREAAMVELARTPLPESPSSTARISRRFALRARAATWR